jgi:hypothetical protein
MYSTPPALPTICATERTAFSRVPTSASRVDRVSMKRSHSIR